MSSPGPLFSLRTQREHAAANRALGAAFRARGARVQKIRLQEGPPTALYLAELDIWLAAHALPNRYRNALGPGDPTGRKNVWPSVQLNLALSPGSARPRARFVRDTRDQLWVAHSGTLGGRQVGLSRTTFVRLLGGATPTTVDGVAEELVILGTFARPIPLLDEIARLTHTAHELRSALAAGITLG